tara:strand:+ start:1134 stop:1553 length:420 start_codon:yes stop_codon:yes gene_type:complete
MRVGVLLVTHAGIGQAMLDCVLDMMGELPLRVAVLGVDRADDSGVLEQEAKQLLVQLEGTDAQAADVLILTDAFGATPGNIASSLARSDRTALVAGLNLPMLVRVMNYPDAGLEELSTIAVEGGRRGTLRCSSDAEHHG